MTSNQMTPEQIRKAEIDDRDSADRRYLKLARDHLLASGGGVLDRDTALAVIQIADRRLSESIRLREGFRDIANVAGGLSRLRIL
jgi:hypothetical protein